MWYFLSENNSYLLLLWTNRIKFRFSLTNWFRKKESIWITNWTTTAVKALLDAYSVLVNGVTVRDLEAWMVVPWQHIGVGSHLSTIDTSLPQQHMKCCLSQNSRYFYIRKTFIIMQCICTGNAQYHSMCPSHSGTISKILNLSSSNYAFFLNKQVSVFMSNTSTEARFLKQIYISKPKRQYKTE